MGSVLMRCWFFSSLGCTDQREEKELRFCFQIRKVSSKTSTRFMDIVLNSSKLPQWEIYETKDDFIFTNMKILSFIWCLHVTLCIFFDSVKSCVHRFVFYFKELLCIVIAVQFMILYHNRKLAIEVWIQFKLLLDYNRLDIFFFSTWHMGSICELKLARCYWQLWSWVSIKQCMWWLVWWRFEEEVFIMKLNQAMSYCNLVYLEVKLKTNISSIEINIV